nr:metalloregulator ArsR/SmtB family transcription factor [Flexistipes sinusarabici]
MEVDMLDEYANKFKAIGHPVRLRIVMGLAKKECNVTKICEGLGLPQATISRHLALLRNLGIVEGVRDGHEICYSLVDDKIAKIVDLLMEEE